MRADELQIKDVLLKHSIDLQSVQNKQETLEEEMGNIRTTFDEMNNKLDLFIF